MPIFNILTTAMMIVSLIGGGALATGGWTLWNKWVDNPRVVAAAKAEMVSKAEYAAAQARMIGLKKIADKQKQLADEASQRAAMAEKAQGDLQASLNQYNIENSNLQDQVNELLSKPVGTACVVDKSLAGKLRGR